ncbi:MAG: MMPL family transporter [Gammaproteobacteria bacterium]|nr:MMPL family transporter [Gammaproteobacteria bacterium]MCP5199736.1 MMPL family transporter [Gammaproteobacteria bacterium]
MSIRHRIAALVIGYRHISLAILMAITAFFLYGLKDVEIRTIFSDLFPKDHPFVQTFQDHRNFGNPLTITIMIKNKHGDIYNHETLNKVWRMTRDIDLAPSVDHDQILSLASEKARYAEATPYGVDIKPMMEDSVPDSPEAMEEFKHRVDRSNNVRKFLISEDETATLLTATFIEFSLDYGKTFDYVQKLVERERDENHEIYAAGQPMLTGWVYTYQVQMLTIFAITATLLIVSLILYMRNLPGVVAPIAVSIVGGIWGFGLTGWIHQPIEPLIMVVPMLLIARAFSHCVQYLERYYEVLYEVRDKRKAAQISLGVMMAPGILGIITDMMCLFLIAVAPIPVMERFAIFCGFWALALIPTDVFLSSILASYLPTPKNVDVLTGHTDKVTWHTRLIGILKRVASLSHGSRAPLTTAVFVVIFGFGFYTQSLMQVGNPVEGSNLLFNNSEFNTAVRAINSHFPGLMTLEIVFEGKGGKKANRILQESETMQVMHKMQRLLESYPQPPEATLSFADYLPEANRIFAGGNPKWAPIDPNDEASNASVNALMLGSSPKAYSHVMDFGLQNGTLSLWYKNNKQETVDVALKQAREVLKKVGIDHNDFTIRMATGAIALQQSVNDVVAQNRLTILALLNGLMFVVCSFAYRSPMAGIILLVPVNLSNVLLDATMVTLGIGLDVNSLPIASIGIGVGIDYGIYLLSRMCEEFQDSQHYGDAIDRAITTSGKAITFTATIVLISILPWYFLSDLKFLSDMGLLLVMVMTINMVISLMVLPLMVWWIKPKFIASEHQLISEKIDYAEHAATV